MHKGVLYDIDGAITNCADYHDITEEELKGAIHWSFSKRYMLNVGNCQNCGEVIKASNKEIKK